MSNGLQAALRPAASTETVLFTCPAVKDAVVNVRAMNASGTVTALIRIGVQNVAGSFVAADYVYYNYPLLANSDPLELTGIVLTAGQSIRVWTDTATVNFHANAVVSGAS